MKIVTNGHLQAWWAGRKPICQRCQQSNALRATHYPKRFVHRPESVEAVFDCRGCGAELSVLKKADR